MRIAVIGTGIGGLSAAWWLGSEHELTVYERLPSLGMAAHGVVVGAGDETRRVDVPLRVVYQGYYPTLLGLYREAGIETAPVDYSGAFAELGGPTYFRYRNRLLGGLSVSYLWGREALRPTSLRITRDIVRFYATAPRELRRGELQGETIASYLARKRYSSDFVDRFVLPTFAGIGTCSYAAVRAYPAAVIVDYLTRGVLFEGVRRTVRGADFVVERLASRVSDLRCGVSIESVQRGAEGTLIATEDGSRDRYDHVIIATQANQALRILKDARPEEIRAMESFGYERSRVVVHTDARLAPARRADWAPVNFFVDPAADRPMATIWMNAVLPLPADAEDVFQTWNPLLEPDPDAVLARAEFDRPLVDERSSAGVEVIDRLHAEPDRKLWFCGSYSRSGVPLLESAAASAARVAARIGLSPAGRS